MNRLPAPTSKKKNNKSWKYGLYRIFEFIPIHVYILVYMEYIRNWQYDGHHNKLKEARGHDNWHAWLMVDWNQPQTSAVTSSQLTGYSYKWASHRSENR